jgi:hypothetical protein
MKFRVDTDTNPLPPDPTNPNVTNVNLSDFPKIGYNADGYVISFNMFPNNNVPLAHVAILSVDNVGTSYGMRTIAQGANNSTLAPASMYDALPSQAGMDQTPMWFVQAEGFRTPGETVKLIRLNNPFDSSPVATQTYSISVPPYGIATAARQPAGGQPLFFPPTDFAFSAMRTITDGTNSITHLVAAHNIGVLANPVLPAGATNPSIATGVRWYDFVMSGNNEPSLHQQGTINPNPSTTDNYLPTIAIAPGGSLGLTYSQSGANEHLSMYVATRRAQDQLGSMQTPRLVKGSNANLNGTNSRVGDYSFVAVDPVDGTFWAVNEYARNDISNPNWGTWIQQFRPVSGLRVMDVVISKSTADPRLHPPHHLAFGNAKGPMAGSGRQLLTVPVGGADTVSITFSEPVSNLQADHLRVIGLRTGRVLTRAEQDSFDYDEATRTARWTFSNWPVESHHDHYLISLSDQVVSAVSGAPLDGDWTNPGRLFQNPTGSERPYFEHQAISRFRSGDGTPGGPFTFIVTMLAGDSSGDNSVNTTADILPALANVGLMGMTFFLGDFDGNGSVAVTNDMLPALASVGVERRILRVVWLPGDYDDDLDLDAFDQLVFDEYYAASAIEADVNGDTSVTPADFDLFYALFNFDLSLSIAA